MGGSNDLYFDGCSAVTLAVTLTRLTDASVEPNLPIEGGSA